MCFKILIKQSKVVCLTKNQILPYTHSDAKFALASQGGNPFLITLNFLSPTFSGSMLRPFCQLKLFLVDLGVVRFTLNKKE